MKMFATLVVVSFSLTLSGGADASTSEAFALEPTAKASIEAVIKPTGAEATYFAGPSGTIGVGLTMPNGKQMVIYASPDGKTLFAGMAIDAATGENITRRDMELRLPEPDMSAVARKASEATAVAFSAGSSEEHIYVFFDPFCDYCHKTYALLDAYRKNGDDKSVHWVPVATMGPRSENTAKALLGMAEPNKKATFEKLMQGIPTLFAEDDVNRGTGDFRKNMAIFESLGVPGVPAIVIDDVRGARVIAGLPGREDLDGRDPVGTSQEGR